MMHLKVVEAWQEIPPVRDHDVPVFIKPFEHGLNWDLTTTQVLISFTFIFLPQFLHLTIFRFFHTSIVTIIYRK